MRADGSVPLNLTNDPAEDTQPAWSPVPADAATAIEENRQTLPGTFSLAQNYPNPFNSNTEIAFTLPTDASMEITVFNIAGQSVATLARHRHSAGFHKLRWDGRDDRGQPLASGVYVYRLRAGDNVRTRRLILSK